MDEPSLRGADRARRTERVGELVVSPIRPALLPKGWSAQKANRLGLDQKNVVRAGRTPERGEGSESQTRCAAHNCRLKRPGLRRARLCLTALRRPRSGTTGEA